MKVETEALADRQVKMTVEVDDNRLQRALQIAARRISKEIKVPGFRPGKAPYNIVAQKVGEDYLLDEALDEIGQEVYRQALEEAELEPFAPGSLNEIVSRQPLVLSYTVPLEPEIELGDYHDIRIEYEEPEVDDEDVEDVLDQLRQGQALIEPVERPAERGDVIVVNVTGILLETDEQEGEQQPLMEEENASLLLEEENDWPFPGITEHLLGMETGTELTIEHTFPEDYANEELQEKKASFQFECLEVKSRIVPEWTDSLAQNLGDFDDLLALRIKVRENLEDELTNRHQSEFRDEVMDQVIEGATIVYPPYLLDREIDDMLHDLEHRLNQQNLSLEDYSKLEGRSLEELRQDYEEDAEARLMRGLILGKIVEAENIEVSDENIDEAIDRFVEPLGENAQDIRQQLDTPTTRRQIELDLLTEKAVERLMAIAKGQHEFISEDRSIEDVPQESSKDPAEDVVDDPAATAKQENSEE